MTKINKAHWTADEKTIRLDVEFSKVNKAKRLVSGWATLDNVDTENDVVTAEASADAFARARGNLREMHKKDSAVGRVVSFKEDTLRVKENGEYKEYKGIFVTARVSEGAQDTWLKVLDGTLSGFSIGGEIVDSEEVFNKDSGNSIRKVTKYNLNELSLVDNPGNQYADVFRIQKSADGSVTSVTGMVEEQTILNVFYCDDDNITQERPDDSHQCPVCLQKMKNIGFIEDGGDRDIKVNELLTKYLDPDLSNETSGGGEEMAKGAGRFIGLIKSAPVVGPEDNETEATGHEEGDPTEVPTPAETENEEVNEVEDNDIEEVHDEADEISKQIDGLKASIREILEDRDTEVGRKIEALEKTVRETKEILDKRLNEVETNLSGLSENVAVQKSRIAELDKSLEKMNSGTAFKKSIDSDESREIEQDNDPWQGSAFSVHDLYR